MKKVLVFTLALILVLAATDKAEACYRAFQFRLFPIGSADSGLVFIESDLTHSAENFYLWGGKISLKIRRFDGSEKIIKAYDSVRIMDSSYAENMKPYFREFIRLASEMPGFIKGGAPYIDYCKYKKKCSLASISADKKNNLALKLKKGKKYDIKYPENVLKEIHFLGKIESQPFFLQSVRKMKIGEKEYIIANIGTGEPESTYSFKNQFKDKKQYDSVDNCIYEELRLYHGLCFDTIIPI